MSAPTAIASKPDPRSSAARFSAPSASTSARTSLQPLSASRRTIASPMPRGFAVPVTTATLPSKSCNACPFGRGSVDRPGNGERRAGGTLEIAEFGTVADGVDVNTGGRQRHGRRLRCDAENGVRLEDVRFSVPNDTHAVVGHLLDGGVGEQVNAGCLQLGNHSIAPWQTELR